MIILDNAADIGANGGATTVTFTSAMAVANQLNRILFYVNVGNIGAGSSDYATNVTWHGQAMTRMRSVQTGPGGRWMSYWYLVAPDAGTYNIVVTNSTSAYTQGYLASFYGVKQIAPEAIGTATNGEGSNGGFAADITSVYSNFIGYRTDNPQITPGTYNFNDQNGKTCSVTTVTSGAWVIGFKNSSGATGSPWCLGAISVAAIPDPSGGDPMFFSSGGLALA